MPFVSFGLNASIRQRDSRCKMWSIIGHWLVGQNRMAVSNHCGHFDHGGAMGVVSTDPSASRDAASAGGVAISKVAEPRPRAATMKIGAKIRRKRDGIRAHFRWLINFTKPVRRKVGNVIPRQTSHPYVYWVCWIFLPVWPICDRTQRMRPTPTNSSPTLIQPRSMEGRACS